jgi:hypothetical protein
MGPAYGIESSAKMTLDFVATRQAGVVRDVIRDYFAKKGLDIEQMVKARQADPLGLFCACRS